MIHPVLLIAAYILSVIFVFGIWSGVSYSAGEDEFLVCCFWPFLLAMFIVWLVMVAPFFIGKYLAERFIQ